MLNKWLNFSVISLLAFIFFCPIVIGININIAKLKDPESVILNGPVDSPWPMKCYNKNNTGRSPYSTSHITSLEKWRFKCDGVDSSPIVDNEGIIYFGDKDDFIYALYPNGTLKWTYKTDMWITSAPALDEDKTLYICSWDKYLYALNSSNGNLRWKLFMDEILSISSPTIADDGTIYFGGGHFIFAVKSNGVEKWRYKTGSNVHSSPAIAEDGTIYIGSWDKYLYAMNQNGTVKWRFKTGDIIKGSASIADDGTVYVGSFDDHLYAIYPNNGTLKWKCKFDYGSESSPSIASDGTVYFGSYKKLYAVYPNGTKRWSFNIGSTAYISWSCPAISSDGTIYVGTQIDDVYGGDIIAINPDGIEKWRKRIADDWIRSSPCINEDGTVYIGSECNIGGYLHAFGPVESNEPPETPIITGKQNGNPGEEYIYKLMVIDQDNNPISFYIDWGDGKTTGWTFERASGENCYYEHTWIRKGNYTIRAKARDTLGEESDWGYLEVIIPRTRTSPYQWLKYLFERYPILERLLDLIKLT